MILMKKSRDDLALWQKKNIDSGFLNEINFVRLHCVVLGIKIIYTSNKVTP